MITWVISIVMAIGFFIVLIGMCISDKFLGIVGTIITFGTAITALTIVMHWMFFE